MYVAVIQLWKSALDFVLHSVFNTKQIRMCHSITSALDDDQRKAIYFH